MKILIASDSYKHCLSSKKVGECLKEGILKALPDAEITVMPVADGGEGTVDALVDALEGQFHEAGVHGPLIKPVTARFGTIYNGTTAVIEMSSASGIELLNEGDLNPLKTTTIGTGELILKALDLGCKRIVVGLGGSATNDAGAGMLQALGVKLLDKRGKEIPVGGGSLSQLTEIDLTGLDPRIDDTEIVLASDVQNPLTGKNGATYVYGPQKGAGEKEIEILDKNLDHFADLTLKTTGKDLRDQPGAGAAGGIGFGFMAFLDADLRNGFELISEMNNLEEAVADCDLVITGEGKIDFQTRFGKTPFGVATLAGKYDKPVIGFAGTLGKGYETLLDEGFDALFSITDSPMSLEKSILNASTLLKNAGRNVAALVKIYVV